MGRFININLQIDKKETLLSFDLEKFLKINCFEDLIWWKKDNIFKNFAKRILEFQYLYESDHLTILDKITKDEIDEYEDLSLIIEGTFLNELYCSKFNIENNNVVVGISINQIEDFRENKLFLLTKVYIYIHEKECFYRFFSKSDQDIDIKIKSIENCSNKLKIYRNPDPIDNKFKKIHINTTINNIYKNETIKIYKKKNAEKFNKSKILHRIIKKLDYPSFNPFYVKDPSAPDEKSLTFYEKLILKNCGEYFSIIKNHNNINLYKEIFKFAKIIDYMNMDILYQFLVKKIFENFSEKYDEKILAKISLDLLFLFLSNGMFKTKDMMMYLKKHDNEKEFLTHFIIIMTKNSFINIDEKLKSKIFRYTIDELSKYYGSNIVNKILISIK